MNPIPRPEYLAAFPTWLTAWRANLTDTDETTVAVRRTLDRIEPVIRSAIDAGGLPDEAPVEAFCAILRPRFPFSDPDARTALLAIEKSCLLDRLIYARQPLRTVKCPEHRGVWSGVEMPRHWPLTNACPHGCGLTGWLPLEPLERT